MGLNDDQSKQQPKRKSFFSKFGGEESQNNTSRFHITGRKRGQSGTGEELGNMPVQRPATAEGKEVVVTEEG